MKKFLISSMMICLVAVLIMSQSDLGVRAQLKVNGASAPVATPVTKTVSTASDLLALLPASDLVATVDVNRALNDLLPRLSELGVDVSKMSGELQEFSSKTGIDPSKIQSAVLGFTLNGTQAKGAIILQGVDLDSKKLEAGLKAYKAEYKTVDHKGTPVFLMAANKVKSPSAGPLSVKTDEMVLVALGQQRLVLGDLSAVKNVIDINSGAAKGGVAPAMANALNETRSSALVRYALSVPENLRQEAADQGDLFKSFSTIKLILGTFDVAKDFTLSLDAVMRTSSQSEAGELETGLKGVVSLARNFLGGSDPKLEMFGQLIDQVKIGSKLSDVSLSINVPRTLMEQLTKKTAKK